MAEDEALILSWRNDPFLAARATDRRAIGVEEHARWFRSGLSDPTRRLQIIEIDGNPAGCVRFDRVSPERAVISIGLAERFTGKGYGTDVIRRATAAIMQDWCVSVLACVRDDNVHAIKAFSRAGYIQQSKSPCPAGQCAFVASQ